MPVLTRRVSAGVAALGLALAAGTGTAVASAPIAGSGTPLNDPVTVQLTVTGADTTLLDTEIEATGGTVSPVSGGDQLCDGTNAGANDAPGATPTSTLDASGLDWDGEWYAEMDDYLVTEIDGEAPAPDAFWMISVNGTATSVGGCQFQLADGDEVAFTWTAID